MKNEYEQALLKALRRDPLDEARALRAQIEAERAFYTKAETLRCEQLTAMFDAMPLDRQQLVARAMNLEVALRRLLRATEGDGPTRALVTARDAAEAALKVLP